MPDHIYFHPPVVHFPIAFYVLECFLLGLWTWKRDDQFKRFAFLVFRLGYLFMVAAMIAGYVDAGGITSVVRRHFFAALGTLAVYTVRGILWCKLKETNLHYRQILFWSSVAGILIVAFTALEGGELVYSGEHS